MSCYSLFLEANSFAFKAATPPAMIGELQPIEIEVLVDKDI